MSDNIPIEIQMEIIKKVSDVKSLIQFRSVSKSWKSFIDSSEFINGFGARHTQPHSFILFHRVNIFSYEYRYILLVEDHDKNENFKLQQQELAPAVVSPLIKPSSFTQIVGSCHGLLCLYCHRKNMLVIWNPSIRKSFGIAIAHNSFLWRDHVYGFGVCPNTGDPTVVKIIQRHNKPWHVEVFTLSSGIWNVIPSTNMLHQSIKLTFSSQVAIDRFIYWVADDTTFVNGVSRRKYMLVSFDLITKEFKVIDLPDSVTNKLCSCSVSKLRESLVVYGSKVKGAEGCDVWVMEHDFSFKKLFSIGAWVDRIVGFMDSGKPILQTVNGCAPDVYDSGSKQINSLGIYGARNTFSMGSHKESLLLLDHSDLHIYCVDN